MPTVGSAQQATLARFARTESGRGLLSAAGGGDIGAAKEISSQTGVPPLDVVGWAADLFTAEASSSSSTADLTPAAASGQAAPAGRTVAHLTGFRGVEVEPTPEAKASDREIAQALAAVVAGYSLDLLNDDVRAKIAPLVEGKTAEQLKTPEGAAEVYAAASKAIGEESVASALGDLAVSVNAYAQSTGNKTSYAAVQEDSKDWHHTWGLNLLKADDPAFRDPEYLMALFQESGPLRSTFQFRQTRSRAKQRFESAFRAFAPNLRPMAYTDSGSDAVSLCFDIARAAGRRRLNIRDPSTDPRQWGVAFFDGAYGGGRGESAGMNWERYNKESRPNLEHHRLPDCSSYAIDPKDPEEVERLDKAEGEALTQLRAMAADDDKPIGAIMLEPVLGSKGVRFYRKEFVQKVRALATELKLPLILDEVLTSGGRTGKPFAYEHYGIEPDVVTFGKAMQASGVAINTKAPVARPGMLGITTVDSDAVRLLKGAAFLERVVGDDLVNKGAEVGAYLLERLQARDEPGGRQTTGMGMLIGSDVDLSGVAGSFGEERGDRQRFMPPLTLTKAEVDDILGPEDDA